MAPSSGGTCSFNAWSIRQWKRMNEELQASLGVSLLMPPGKPVKFRILGDLGPIRLPTVCFAGSSQTVRIFAESACQVILAKQQEQSKRHVACCQLWLLKAHSATLPVSSFWVANCPFGLPEVDSCAGETIHKAHRNSEQVQRVDGSLPKLDTGHVEDEGACVSLSVCAKGLGNSLQHFGLPLSSCGETGRFAASDVVPSDMPVALSHVLKNFGVPHPDGKEELPTQQATKLAWIREQFSVPVHEPNVPCQRVSLRQNQVCCGEALPSLIYSTLASLQSCFAYLQGMRVGEAAHPGPRPTQVSLGSQVKHDPNTGVRIGEAKNPVIKQYVMEAVREAIKEAFQNLGLSAPGSSVATTSATQGSQQATNSASSQPDKGSPKGKGKPPKQSPKELDRGKGKQAPAPKPVVSKIVLLTPLRTPTQRREVRVKVRPRTMSGSWSPGSRSRVSFS